jgi:SAM-dependent MidA family methyltransferase
MPPGIAAQLAAEGGRVTFARFMELALTHPTEGYYSRAARLLGPRGDFSTAPRLSQAFNDALGRLLEELIDAVLAPAGVAAPVGAPGADRVTLVELGGGEGDLAKALLARWARTRPDLRERLSYVMVEVGDRLRRRQQALLANFREAGWEVRWAGSPEEALAAAGAAILVGNEFIDALPVHIVYVRGEEPIESWVTPDREVGDRLSREAETELGELFGTTDPVVLRRATRDGTMELRPAAGQLLHNAALRVGPVCLLTVDYGEWFSAPAPAGRGREPQGPVPSPLRRRTVRGYFRHQVVPDPYVRIGRQDLTADVDFQALDHHGRQVGLETVLFSTVAGLLRANGAEQQLERLRAEAASPSPRALSSDRQASVLEQLIDEQGLGGAFKVMLQVKE